jgi:hypothetical protein
MAKVRFRVSVNQEAIKAQLNSLLDEETMLEIHKALAKICEPYVPYKTGALNDSGLAQIAPDGVIYGGDGIEYAEYQYYGVNHNFNKEHHPLATAMWGEVALRERGDEFYKMVEEILAKRSKELFG